MLAYNPLKKIFVSDQFGPRVVHGFGTRRSGNGRNPEDIKKYLQVNNISYARFIDPDQQHTDNIVVVDHSTSDLDLECCDGLITQEQGAVLTVITADCAPILYWDSAQEIIGISHNGRKGTEKELSKKMIHRFCDLGSQPQDLHVAIGPCIGNCCYPVNLIEENVLQLISTGLQKDQVDFFPFCTKCDADRFFSYRGSADKQNFPEQFTFIMLPCTVL